MGPQTFASLSFIVANLSIGRDLYQGWEWVLHEKVDGFLLQGRYMEEDVLDPGHGPVPQSTRKWYISAHSTETEVVRTAWKLVLCSLEHRLGEAFTYMGKRPYGPHVAVDRLTDNDRTDFHDVRPEPGA